ncbi:MAG: recombination-associated protein RdgC [Hydrogenophaga sp.]|nr:recombination-associated protein RdgC [Hydrogenophaga sp.]
MFKNINLYRLPANLCLDAFDVENALATDMFAPCGATQDKSMGWVPPRGEANGALVEAVGGPWILKLMTETKSVPGAVVRAKAHEAADHIEATTGRKVGKKQMKELREDALLALLPQAFAKQVGTLVWIDRGRHLLVIDASSQARLDDAVTALVRSIDGISMSLLQTAVAPQTAMAQWLVAEDVDGWPGDFSVERECELRSGDEDKAVVKFSRHHLCTPEIRKHVAEGKLPKRLAMSYAGRVAFTLTEGLQLRRLAFLEGVFDGRGDDSGFDADVALATGELGPMIDALIDALGGEFVMQTGGAL